MKRALIICSPDDFANAVKPRHLTELFTKNGYEVTPFSTNTLSRLSKKGILYWLPGWRLNQLWLYWLELWHLLATTRLKGWLKKRVLSWVLLPILRTRGRLLTQQLQGAGYDILICENNLDQAIVQTAAAKVQILDLPAPFAEEVYYGGDLTARAYQKLKTYEAGLYGQATYLSFHWHTYADFVRKNKYQGKNVIDLSYGTTPKTTQARYASKPKMVFLGYLGGYWVNLPLLAKLAKRYPIDVYGGPKPPAELGLNYRGYAPSLKVLADYQFGLITITDDPLRRSSFSSKQLEYYSYGLPVFTPNWRPDSLLAPGAIPFNLDNFSALVTKYSAKKAWQAKSQAAHTLAAKLSWQRALQPLQNIIERQLHEN